MARPAIIVGLGGSATTDGGFGALRAIRAPGALRGVELLVACDVTTPFVDAAEVFGPQKGASPAQVALLQPTRTARRDLPRRIRRRRHDVPGAGRRAGWPAGWPRSAAQLVPGFELVADEVELAERLGAPTSSSPGEGHLDAQSFEGKVVGGVVAFASEADAAVARDRRGSPTRRSKDRLI